MSKQLSQITFVPRVSSRNTISHKKVNVNVSGYNFVEGDYAILSVKKDLEDIEYVFQKRVDKFEDNKIVFLFTEDDTDIEAGLYMYDVKIYLSDGRRDRLIKPSEFEVFVGVTND